MDSSADENRRSIMEVLYRHKTSGGSPVSLEELGSLDFIEAGRLLEDITYLEALDYVELFDGCVKLTGQGFMIMENRELSYCPHL